MIALTFLENPENKPTVNHKNRVKNDNCVDNLEWATYSEQNRHVHETQGSSLYKYEGIHYKANTNEEWKDIIETDYEISNYGYVRNKIKGTTRVLARDARGYISICLHGKSYSIHRLVAKTFMPSFYDECVINHIDGNKSNNHISNLECVTQRQNICHAYQENLIKKTKRTFVQQYDMNGDLIGEYPSLAEAEAKTGINRGCIHHAIKRDRPSKGYVWKSIQP